MPHVRAPHLRDPGRACARPPRSPPRAYAVQPMPPQQMRPRVWCMAAAALDGNAYARRSSLAALFDSCGRAQVLVQKRQYSAGISAAHPASHARHL